MSKRGGSAPHGPAVAMLGRSCASARVPHNALGPLLSPSIGREEGRNALRLPPPTHEGWSEGLLKTIND